MCIQNYFSDLKLIHQESIFNETEYDVWTEYFIQFISVSLLRLYKFKFFPASVCRAKLALQKAQSGLFRVYHCKQSGSVTIQVRKIVKNGYYEKCL
jgi:hypothetical protein